MSPLWRTRSIKMKFSIVIVSAIATAVATSQVGYVFGWPLWLRPLLAAALSLGLVQYLAHGMTYPLRTMTRAAQEIAQGHYEQRIDTTSVDEVGQLAAAFNSMAADLAVADRQRRDLIANVSHELRTPIAGIKAMLDNLQDGVTTATPDAIGAMHGRIERLSRLVADLLDLSRLEAGIVQLATQRTPLGPLVDGAIEELQLDHPLVAIAVSIPEDLTVSADPQRLHQVVLNLLENAIRHGRTPVRVDARQVANEVHVAVSDSGPGLPIGGTEQVFERFYRADATGSNDGGSGLGLAIVRWITELHGGRVSASNLGPPESPTGASFVIALPTVALPSAAPPRR
jgi:signal transduction histidine kinase